MAIICYNQENCFPPILKDFLSGICLGFGEKLVSLSCQWVLTALEHEGSPDGLPWNGLIIYIFKKIDDFVSLVHSFLIIYLFLVCTLEGVLVMIS